MKKIMAAALSTLMIAGIVHADTLRIPVGQQASEKQEVARPQTGTDKEQVKQRFGEPREVAGPVGEPPITTWYYDDFIVYFEHSHVIHSVLKRDDES